MTSEWERREDDRAILCPNCRRWTLDTAAAVDAHLRGLCTPPRDRQVKVVPRGPDKERNDIERVREALERGGELDKRAAFATMKIPERRFRKAVSSLRAEGYPVVSWSERGSRYRKAIDQAELDTFIASEIDSRIADLATQKAALQRERRRWLEPIVIPPIQEKLVGV